MFGPMWLIHHDLLIILNGSQAVIAGYNLAAYVVAC